MRYFGSQPQFTRTTRHVPVGPVDPREVASGNFSPTFKSAVLPDADVDKVAVVEERAEAEDNKNKATRMIGLVGLLGHPFAMAMSYKRNPQLSGGKRLGKAFLTGFIWLPYLIYVAVDKKGKK